VYSFVRFEAYNNSKINGVLMIFKIIPILIYLVHHNLYQAHSIEIDKKNQSETKLSKKILDLLPEGVAVLDRSGLLWTNSALQTILGTDNKDE
jgi:hypothetical protein